MQPGKLLCDRYQIDRPLAPGGFGQTFVAVDTHLPSHPQVVVKLLKPINNDPATLKITQRLFNTEAAILERLGKDNDRIPSLHAHFPLNGEFYLVQEYIEGQTLTQELQGQRISESDTLAILKEILTGLMTVHPTVIHRDLKPDNIIRRAKDRKLVLIDFGAVKQIRTATFTTPNPAISRTIGIGTPGYMPSEQGIGYPKPASDIYAVGTIAIQCLTGSAPHLLFDEDSLTIEWEHLRQVSQDLAQVLNKMIAPKYQQRYANAAEALEAIESLLTPAIPPPVIPNIPANPVVSPPPPTPNQSPVNQSVKLPLPNPPNHQVEPASKPLNRLNFLKWLGFSGIGMASALAIGQLGKNSSSDKAGSSSSFPKSAARESAAPTVPDLASNLPKLTKIQFTSVRLDRNGNVIGKPAGSAEILTEDLGNSVELKMVKIPAGKFLMGSPASEQDRQQDEGPQHQVNVSEFYLGQTLVTQAQWTEIMGNNPAHFQENNKLPVEDVSWLDTMDFCQKLSQKTGKIYRLPSEAEWEYACRAGTTSPFAFGETITPAVVNYKGDYPDRGSARGQSRGKTTPGGLFPPNLFGLYDLHGNLWEWCLDEWADSYDGAPNDGSARGDIKARDKNKRRVLRGGSWSNLASNCRAADRYVNFASLRYISIGFRVVCLLSTN
jgi:eukaryotic-like serine/threonine-protein kinase